MELSHALAEKRTLRAFTALLQEKTMKTSTRFLVGITTFSSLAMTMPASSASLEKDPLQQQIEQLNQQNQLLTQRITDLEKNATAPQSKESGRKINDYVTLSGAIEGEASFGDDLAGNSTSEFTVATVELGIDAQVTDWVSGHILAKYEGGDDDDLFIDEASITLGNSAQLPLLLTAGKIYMPFGTYETNMLQDPLTLSLAEIGDYGVTVEFEDNGFYGAAFGFNGMDEAGDTSINGVGLKVGYAYEDEVIRFGADISWTNTIASSGGITDSLEENGLEAVLEQVGGLSTSLFAAYGPVAAIVEYTTALGSFAASDLSFGGSGAEPKAWNIELGYTTTLLEKETTFALGYQGSDEALALGLPESRYIGAVNMNICDGTTLSLEYFVDEDYSVAASGTGETANLATVQLAYSF